MLTALGAGSATDALFASLAIPVFVTGALAIPLSRVLVPFLSAGDREPGTLWTVVAGSTLLFTALAAVTGGSAPLWIPWMLPGFDRETIALTVSLLRIQLPGLVLVGLATVLRAAHHARHRFVPAAVCSSVSAAAGLGVILLLLPRWGVASAAWSFTARNALECVLLLGPLAGGLVPRWSAGTARAVWRHARPVVAGASYERTEPLVDRLLSSLAPAGALSLFSLAEQIHGAASQVLNRSVSDPLVPSLSRMAAERRWADMRHAVVRRLRGAALLAGTGIVLLLSGGVLLDLLPGVGNLRPADLQLLWLMLALLGGWFLGDPAANLLFNTFYAMGDSVTPARLGVLSYTLGIGLKLAGFAAGGVAGLAAGTSAYYLLRALVLYLALQRRWRTLATAG